ncbi:MAG: hypothetical protein ACRC0V_00620 [Fusobacteriaceae bacterium]
MIKEKELYSADSIKEFEISKNLENKNFKIDFSKAEKFSIEDLKLVEDFINEMIKQEKEMCKFLNENSFSKTLKLCDSIEMEIIK